VGYVISVTAANANGAGAALASSSTVYAVASTALTVNAPTFGVATGVNFSVVVTGAAPGASVSVLVGTTTVTGVANSLGQLVVSAKVSTTGSATVKATTGGKSVTTKVHAPKVTVAKTVVHGKTLNVAIATAPPKAAVLVSISDGRKFTATASATGAADVKVSAPTKGTLTVTVSVGGNVVSTSTVTVS
jgi:hypothetical protein